VKIHFCKSRDIGGSLIRLFLFSRWNHVAIEIGGIVFEAVSRGGVRAVPANQFPSLWAEVKTVEVTAPDSGESLHFLRRQLGKPYDWRALVALPFRADWHRSQKWFCSELVAEAMRQGGRDLNLPSHRVTPRDLFVALPEVRR